MDTGLGIDLDCCGMGGGGPFTSPLGLPLTENFLIGDTARVSVFATGDAKSTWEISGPAVFVLGPDSVSTQVTTPVTNVLVRGTGTGAVTLTARRALFGETAISTFFVADPSEVTLRMSSSDIGLKVGADRWIEAHLRDSAGRYYRGRLTWASTDSSTVTLVDNGNVFLQGKFARGFKVGIAYVVVAMPGQRDSARAVVEP
jgi:hypothetical protein